MSNPAPPSPRELLEEVRQLRAAVAREGAAKHAEWRPRIERRGFAASALNFAHYLAFRRRDLRPLQRRLMLLGLSSLGRAESRVLASLDAVAAALAAMAGEPCPRPPSARQFFRGETRLAAETERLFGPRHEGRAGRILVTLGAEAAEDPDLIRKLALHGADALRINCAHDDPDVWGRMVAHARSAEAATGRRLRILMDLGGPKIRTVDVAGPPDRDRLFVGDELLLCRGAAPGTADPAAPFRTGCTIPAVFDRVKIGDRVSVDDGKLRGTIVRQAPSGWVVRFDAGRDKGFKLAPEKGLNFPEVDLGLCPLTEADLAALDFVVAHADMVGLSFVQTAAHVAQAQEAIAARRPSDWRSLALVAKIETPRAVTNLPEIMVQGAGRQPMGVMIARGDLAVEMGFERVAEIQEEILWLCEAAHVPAIWATQVLEDLVKKGLPSRGEMTDAAMAGRAECVMLNKGPNVLAGVEALDHLLLRMGEHQLKKTPTLRALRSWAG